MYVMRQVILDTIKPTIYLSNTAYMMILHPYFFFRREQVNLEANRS